MAPDNFYIKDLKKAYRILREQKNEYPTGSEKRIDLNKQMKELKEKIAKETHVDICPEKTLVIEKIMEHYRKENREPLIMLEKYSVDDLEFHYQKITGKVRSRVEFDEKKVKK